MTHSEFIETLQHIEITTCNSAYTHMLWQMLGERDVKAMTVGELLALIDKANEQYDRLCDMARRPL